MFGARMKIIARAFYRRIDVWWERDTIGLSDLFIRPAVQNCAAAFIASH